MGVARIKSESSSSKPKSLFSTNECVQHPSAVASLREGPPVTLPVLRPGLLESLVLSSTKLIENLFNRVLRAEPSEALPGRHHGAEMDNDEVEETRLAS
jgi:hypothetical protein